MRLTGIADILRRAPQSLDVLEAASGGSANLDALIVRKVKV
jgi:hypothetical protein